MAASHSARAHRPKDCRSRSGGDDVDFHGTGVADRSVDDRTVKQLLESRAPSGAQDELAGVFGGGEVQYGGGDVVGGDLDVTATQLGEQAALVLQPHRFPLDRAARDGCVHADEFRVIRRGDLSGSAQHVLSLGGAGERGDHPPDGRGRRWGGANGGAEWLVEQVVRCQPSQRQVSQAARCSAVK